MSLGSIVVRLTMNTADFETDSARAAKIAEKRAKEIDASFRKASKEIGLALGAAISAAATAAATSLKMTINSMDDLSKAAQKVNLPTEDLSKLKYAGELADVSLDTLVGSLGKLTKSQAAALKSTSEQARVFSALGIAVKDADGNLRKSSDVLMDFADVFKAMKGSPEAMAAGFSLFGRSFQDLVPLLSQGSEGIREAGEELEAFGGVISTEAGQRAEEFNDNLTRLETAAKALAVQVASDLLPDLVRLTDNFVAMTQEGDQVSETATAIADGFRAIGSTIAFLTPIWTAFVDVVRGLSGMLAGTVHAIDSLANANWAGVAAGFEQINNGRSLAIFGRDKVGADGSGKTAPTKPTVKINFAGQDPEPDIFRMSEGEVRLRKQIEALQERLRQALDGDPKKPKKEGKSDAEKEAEALERAYQSLNERMKEQVALFGQEGEAAAIRYQIEFGELAKLDPLKQAELLQRAEKIDLLRDEAEAQKELDAINKRREDAAKQILEDIAFENALLGKTIEEQDTLNKLRWAGVDANSAYGQSIIEANKALHENAQRTADQIEIMDTFRTEASNALADVVNGTKSLKDAFIDMMDNIAQRLTQMIAERWIEQAFGQMGTTGGGGGFWGFLGDLVWGGSGGPGYATGGYTGTGPVNEVAGTVHRGEVVWSQQDIRRSGGVAAVEAMRTGGGGGSRTVNQTFVVQGAPDRRTREQMARASGREAARGIARTGR